MTYRPNLNPWGRPWTEHKVIAGPLGFYAAPVRYILGPQCATPEETGADHLAAQMPAEDDPAFFPWLQQTQWELDTGRTT